MDLVILWYQVSGFHSEGSLFLMKAKPQQECQIILEVKSLSLRSNIKLHVHYSYPRGTSGC